MALSAQTSPAPVRGLKTIVEIGMLTWSTTNTTAGLQTTLKNVKHATFTNVVASSPVADVTSVVQSPDASGNFMISGGTLSIGRTTATSGLKQIYRLEGY